MNVKAAGSAGANTSHERCYRPGVRKLVAVWVGALMGACGPPPPSAASGGSAADAQLSCETPEQAGCAECCEEQAGPTPADQNCYLRRSAGHDYATESELRNRGPCPATCRRCAACTRDRQRVYERLRAQACDCFDPSLREVVNSIDPCFSGGCGCVCSYLFAMSECGPPF